MTTSTNESRRAGFAAIAGVWLILAAQIAQGGVREQGESCFDARNDPTPNLLDPVDLNFDAFVVEDLLTVITNWGACP